MGSAREVDFVPPGYDQCGNCGNVLTTAVECDIDDGVRCDELFCSMQCREEHRKGGHEG